MGSRSNTNISRSSALVESELDVAIIRGERIRRDLIGGEYLAAGLSRTRSDLHGWDELCESILRQSYGSRSVLERLVDTSRLPDTAWALEYSDRRPLVLRHLDRRLEYLRRLVQELRPATERLADSTPANVPAAPAPAAKPADSTAASVPTPAADVRSELQHGEATTRDSRTVFVVCGRNQRVVEGMFDFLRALGLQPIEWATALQTAAAESGEASPFIGDVVVRAIRRATAVVVLLSGDDEARLKSEFQRTDEQASEKMLMPQPRPNVLIEAGMILAHDPRRAILVQVGEIRPISDLTGRWVIRLDKGPGPRNDFANRLAAAGCAPNRAATDWLERDFFHLGETAPSGRVAPVGTESDAGEPDSAEHDERDAVVILSDYFRRRGKAQQVVRFTDIVKETRLPRPLVEAALDRVKQDVPMVRWRVGAETIEFQLGSGWMG